MSSVTRLLLIGPELPAMSWSAALQADGDIVCEELSMAGLDAEVLSRQLEGCDVVGVWASDCSERIQRLVERVMDARPAPLVVLRPSGEHDAVDWRSLGALEVLDANPRTPAEEAALRERIRGASRVTPVVHPRPPRRWGTRRRPPRQPRPDSSGEGRPVVAIASSSGGPAALAGVLAQLPADFFAPVLVVQHLGGAFLPGLVADLTRRCALKVCIAQHGDALEPPRVLFAPDGTHLELGAGGSLRLLPPEGGEAHVPAADVLLSSVAAVAGAAAVGVVLTGIGRDGALGASAIHEAGGLVYGQDEESCVVFGMPKAAWELGAVDQLATPAEIGHQLALRCRQASP